MMQMEKTTDLGFLIMSAKAQLIHVQSLEIMLEGHAEDVSKANRGGEFCEVLEEIANCYLNLAEKIECYRTVNSTKVESELCQESTCRVRTEALI